MIPKSQRCVQTLVSEALLRRLDAFCRETGCSRSEALRAALALLLPGPS